MSQPADPALRKPRRFLPKPIETSSRSSKNNQGSLLAKQQVHLTQLGNTEHRSGFAENNKGVYTEQETVHANSSSNKVADNQQRVPRRFKPQLMETARHSFRPGSHHLALDSLSETQARTSNNTDMASNLMTGADHMINESRFSYSSLLRRQEARRHSFRVPDLPAIPSSCSEESDEANSPPLPSSLSAASRRPIKRSDIMKQLGDDRETHFPEYIFPFPLHPSENQLKEQALAAFPNEQVYQPVDHFAIDREEEESPYEGGSNFRDARPEFRINRRTSSADLPSELEYLRRHKEEAGMKKRQYPNKRRGRFSHINRRTSRSMDKAVVRGETALTQLRQIVSPPMLGGDLVFPQSHTPETTVCEGTHTNNSNCGGRVFSPFSGLWSRSPRPSVQFERDGLWNGTCKLGRHSTHGNELLSSGLITPKHGIGAEAWESSNEASRVGAQRQQNSNLAIHSPGDNFNQSEYTDQQYNGGFVTQIYNYLSLGYPSIARYYDYELSKVSGVPVAALRADDLNTDAKGHVRAHNLTDNGSVTGVCMRWTALRLYIQEWARQQPWMLEADHYHETWGVRERKGSWAL
ncbi:hypothetical protein BDW59DRAFT_164923 [Aspergillus cavernicola]|uniref:Uncharacterized protein n=1 Tax=Aspergillus cavernicola TaxID=176166 RepID=A0ABR4HWK8_9EURO